MNELSFEDFFSAGTGTETKENFVISSEGYDGFADGVFADADQAMENLDFLTSFEAVSRMNAETKIRMLQKIKNNYNAKTIGRENLGYSIESICLNQIQSLEDAVAEPKEGDKPAEQTAKPETSEKKKGFFKTVFGAIAKFFQMIWKAITTAVSKFVEWIKRAFAKKQKEVATDQKTDMTNAETSTTPSTSSDLGKAGQTLDKMKVMFDFSKNINPSGAQQFIATFENYGKSVETFFKKFDEACKKSKVGNTATTHTENEFFNDAKRSYSAILNGCEKMVYGLGLDVKVPKGPNTSKTEDVKRYFSDCEKALVISSNKDGSGNNEAVYKAVKKLFGLEKDTNFSSKSVEAKARAQKNIESLASFEKNVFVAKCDPVQKKLTDYANNLQKSIDERLNNNKFVNDTTENIIQMQLALKFACKSEQYISKLFNKLNSCAVEYAK